MLCLRIVIEQIKVNQFRGHSVIKYAEFKTEL